MSTWSSLVPLKLIFPTKCWSWTYSWNAATAWLSHAAPLGFTSGNEHTNICIGSFRKYSWIARKAVNGTIALFPKSTKTTSAVWLFDKPNTVALYQQLSSKIKKCKYTNKHTSTSNSYKGECIDLILYFNEKENLFNIM